MRTLITTLIFLHSLSALCSKPNTQARFFETMAKHLATKTSPYTGLHPHEDTFSDFSGTKVFPINGSDYYRYYESFFDLRSEHISYSYRKFEKALDRDLRVAYAKDTASEFEIVPGLFAKSGKNVVKVANFKENDPLYISYDSIEAQNLIQNMILAKNSNLEPARLPLLAHMFDAASLYAALPRDLMPNFCQSSSFDSDDARKLYIELYR